MKNFVKGQMYQTVIASNESLIYVICTKSSNGSRFEGVCLYEGFHPLTKPIISLNPAGTNATNWDSEAFGKTEFSFKDLLIESE